MLANALKYSRILTNSHMAFYFKMKGFYDYAEIDGSDAPLHPGL